MRWSPPPTARCSGLSVRVVHDGVWGFASDIALTTATAARIAERAVATAKVSRPLTPASVVLADEPAYPDATWVSAYEVDPFEVDEADKVGRMLQLNEALLDSPGISHANAMLAYVCENKFFANLAGTSTTQQRVRIQAHLTAVSVGDARLHDHAHPRPADRPRLGVPDRNRLGLRRRSGRDRRAACRTGRRAIGRGRPLRPGHRTVQPVPDHPRVDRPRHRAGPGAGLRGGVRGHVIRHVRPARLAHLRKSGDERDR